MADARSDPRCGRSRAWALENRTRCCRGLAKTREILNRDVKDLFSGRTLNNAATATWSGGNLGISHNPLESVTADDAELAVQAFLRFLDTLDNDLS